MTTAAKIIPKQQQKKHTKAGFVWKGIGALWGLGYPKTYFWTPLPSLGRSGFDGRREVSPCILHYSYACRIFSNLLTMVRVFGPGFERALGTAFGVLGMFWGVLRSCGPRVRPLLTRPIDCLPIRFLQRSGGINNFFNLLGRPEQLLAAVC